ENEPRPSGSKENSRINSGYFLRLNWPRQATGECRGNEVPARATGRRLVRRRKRHLLEPARLIPQSQFYAVPEPQFVVDGAEIIFDDVFCGSNFVCDFSVLKSLSDEFDDSLLPLVGIGSASFFSDHSCLLYKRVASFTRLTPPAIPKRANKLLKCAFTVRRAM